MTMFVHDDNPRWSPFAVRHSPHSNLYPVGTSPYQDPSCNSARAQGSKGDGTLLPSGMLQPTVVPVTHPTLESVRLFRSSPSAVLITPSEWRTWAPNLSRDSARAQSVACVRRRRS